MQRNLTLKMQINKAHKFWLHGLDAIFFEIIEPSFDSIF